MWSSSDPPSPPTPDESSYYPYFNTSRPPLDELIDSDSSHHASTHTDNPDLFPATNQPPSPSTRQYRRASFTEASTGRLSRNTSGGSSDDLGRSAVPSRNAPRQERRRSFAMSTDANAGAAHPMSNNRRSVRSRLSFSRGSPSFSSASAASISSNSSNGMKYSIRQKLTRQSGKFLGTGRREPAHANQTEEAMAKLNITEGYESILAAAAVVAGSATATASNKSHIRYGVGDKVLVYLSIMNHTSVQNDEESAQARTTNPVNRFGYPPGGGYALEEQRGPYVYVLATVQKVHFEEDARYYTVTRADTGENQRADTDWMEPLTTERGREAAMLAADQNGLEMRKKGPPIKTKTLKSTAEGVKDCYYGLRRTLKRQLTMILNGKSPYGLRLKMTGINFLVLCSMYFMLIDQARLAFLPPSMDQAIIFTSLSVWIILVLELAFEVLIRPEGYNVLIDSEKAYDPSVARFINSFHLLLESIALLLFIPELLCLLSVNYHMFDLLQASLKVVYGPTNMDSLVGRLIYMTVRFRIVGVVRHWKQMWINRTYVTNSGVGYLHPTQVTVVRKNENTSEELTDRDQQVEKPTKNLKNNVEDRHLNNAAHIGTALMVVNSHRAMLLLIFIVGVLPLLYCMEINGGTDLTDINMVSLLQSNNIAFPTNHTCEQLRRTIESWMYGSIHYNPNEMQDDLSSQGHVLWGQLLPIRCSWQEGNGGVFTMCPKRIYGNNMMDNVCNVWKDNDENTTANDFANALNVRPAAIVTYSNYEYISVDGEMQLFNVTVMYNHNGSVTLVNLQSFLLQTLIIILVLIGLTVLREDAQRLVLFPLRRMLKIVLRYASNPLAPPPRLLSRRKKRQTEKNSNSDATFDDGNDDFDDGNQLGKYETEQLINAITKITDLLRKCWGVAGAGIISSNLARTRGGKTVVFNPTVPGKLVYALFSFIGINDFSQHLRALDKDVMLLINDVARVVHDEVFRWGFGESGQCNKNLGPAFLMVFRIGDFEEVEEKMSTAQDVIFSSYAERSKKKPAKITRGRRQGSGGGNITSRRNEERDLKKGTLQLASLPGISAFADRAVLGMLKSFASSHRDRALLNWNSDFRLGAGVGAFSVGMIFGMDAGWAVEGAVGSEYKIDATYLSPHVNMASRMMSACKQYGVTILVSQAVEALLSDQAREKLRHCDTVTVKGSSIKQKIFTYDARYQGVDFFLYERPGPQADIDSDNYTSNIWNTDQDLKAMRQHITNDFETLFNRGRNLYLAGNWPEALERLREANEEMIYYVLTEGFIIHEFQDLEERMLAGIEDDEELNRWKQEQGDGVCKSLIAYMEKYDGKAPEMWEGYRPLTNK